MRISDWSSDVCSSDLNSGERHSPDGATLQARTVSRAVNLALPEADVQARCAESGVSISSIEPLKSGGTHLVCVTRDGADEMRLRLQDHVIAGVVDRKSTRLNSSH